MAKKSSTTRKGLAIGLAVVGIAGLSLASAAQLNLTGPVAGTLQAGTTTVVNADCQTAAIPIKFAVPTQTAGVYKSATIDLTGIQAACANKSYKLVALTSGNAAITGLNEVTGNLGATPGTLTIAIGGVSQAVVDTIGVVSLTIYS